HRDGERLARRNVGGGVNCKMGGGQIGDRDGTDAGDSLVEQHVDGATATVAADGRGNVRSAIAVEICYGDAVWPTAGTEGWLCMVVLPLAGSRFAELVKGWAEIMAGRPSPLRSETATEVGLEPEARTAWAWKLPSPLPKSMLTLLLPLLAVTMSGLPSPLKS